jgi:Mg-chelatase subunit ChlD
VKLSARLAAAAVVLSAAGLILVKSKPDVLTPDANAKTESRDQSNRAKVDLVFAVDTTGSMGGLIEGAKQKIWDIARKAQEGQPGPEVRVGIVAYRDKGDAYVTQVLDLTSDMDEVYARLTELRANGGGDGPEHVLKGLHDAIDAEHWSSDPRAIKLVYLVGDAPPHFDYDDGITLAGVMRDARERGVSISTIRCGSDGETLRVWTDIAQRSGGEVASIAQNGGVVAFSTPYDAELARLNAELARTEVHWGTAAERKTADETLSRNLAAPAAAQADRAAFYAANAAAHTGPTKQDLVAGGGKDLAALDPSLLPSDLRAMSTEERTRFVEQKRKDREGILSQIRETQARRDTFMRTSAPKPAATAFDSKVFDSLKKAGAAKGVAF